MTGEGLYVKSRSLACLLFLPMVISSPTVDVSLNIKVSGFKENDYRGRLSGKSVWAQDDVSATMVDLKWQVIDTITDEQKLEALINFASKLANEAVDLDPRISDIVDEDFWDLV